MSDQQIGEHLARELVALLLEKAKGLGTDEEWQDKLLNGDPSCPPPRKVLRVRIPEEYQAEGK